jgi:CBS domain-containing protein
MFSLYGTAGRLFRGSLEELRAIGPTARPARIAKLAPVARGADTAASVDRAQPHADAAHDRAHRGAVAAYANAAQVGTPRNPLSRVEDIMSHTVVVVAATSTVAQAWGTLAQRQLGQAPVVDTKGVLVGLLTRADLLNPDRLPGPDAHALVWRALQLQSVVDVMWTPVPSVAPHTDIRRLARVLLDTGLPGLPVVDDAGQVIGFVSRSDVLRAVVADPPLDLWT